MRKRRPCRQRQPRRVDEAEHALAREHEAGVTEAVEMGQPCDHNRQPECSATMPPVMRWNDTRAKPARPHHLGKCLGPRKAADRFHQIAIGLGVAGDRAAERRDHVERIEIVERVEPGHIDGGEFEAEEAPADPQHAMGFRERRLDARHVADAERDGDGIEAAVGKRQRLGVAFDERDGVVEPALALPARGRPRACRR